MYILSKFKVIVSHRPFAYPLQHNQTNFNLVGQIYIVYFQWRNQWYSVIVPTLSVNDQTISSPHFKHCYISCTILCTLMMILKDVYPFLWAGGIQNTCIPATTIAFVYICKLNNKIDIRNITNTDCYIQYIMAFVLTDLLR